VSARLLLVGDEAGLARGLSDNFRAEGYDVRHGARRPGQPPVRELIPTSCCSTSCCPAARASTCSPTSGRQGDRVPVLMLTARGEVVDRVVGLELGSRRLPGEAVCTPRARRARVRALLRRNRAQRRCRSRRRARRRALRLPALTAGAGSARWSSPPDILVLKVLAERRGEIVHRIDIVEEVSGLDSEATPQGRQPRRGAPPRDRGRARAARASFTPCAAADTACARRQWLTRD
jgi:DNA-binding response OmpR family regulator